MNLIVQKYGGSSLADASRIQNVARIITKAKEQGNMLIVVVSAMGDTTDELIDLAHSITDTPDERELALLMSTGELVSCTLLSMAIRSLGYKAISLSGGQAGIMTDGDYNHARILDIDPQRIRNELDEDNIVIVAGFQGTNNNMDITTLGRGGSDTTAVALAAKLNANVCEIYTDVEGIYTADPRVATNARKISNIAYEEMLELANYGAKMHPRSIELGALYNVPILVASSFKDTSGTLINWDEHMEIVNRVTGIAHDKNVAKITVSGIPDKPGIAATLFESLAEKSISVDTIVQNSGVDDMADLSFTVDRTDLGAAMSIIQPVAESMGAKGCSSDNKLSKVSIVGTGMQNHPGYASLMFKSLYEADVNIEMITTSEIRITCIVSEQNVDSAVVALHDAFHLEEPG